MICLSVLSQRIGHSEANENPSESVSIPQISGDQERWTVALSGVAAETLYLSSLVSNLRENLLSQSGIEQQQSDISASKNTVSNSEAVEFGKWSLDLNNMDTSINEYLNNAASEEAVRFGYKISNSYEEQLKCRNSDKFLFIARSLLMSLRH